MDRFARRCVPALLAVLLILAPQAGGAVYRWSAVITGVVVIVMAAVALWRTSVRENARVDVTCAFLIGAAAWTAFQLVPLPGGLVRVIAPRIFSLYHEAATLPGAVAPGFIPLTVDTALTATEAVKWGIYATLYAVVLNWPRGGGRTLSYILLAAAALTAVVCLVESVFVIPGILGIYRPLTIVSSWLHGPFVNPGHSGIYCAILGTLCLGLASEVPARLRMWTRGLAAVLLVLALTPVQLKTTVAAILGPLVFFLLRARTANWRFVRGRPMAIGLGVLGIAAVGALRWLPTPEQIRAMPDRYMAFRRYSRLITWADTWGLIKDFAATGVGRGAFGAAFTPYDTVNTEVVTWHAENVPLQMVAEWGCIAAPALMIALAVVVVRAARGAKRPNTSAAAAVLIMLAFVNLVDFDLELLGIGLTAVVCLGILARRETPSVRTRRGLAVLIAPAVLTVLALAALFTTGSRPTEREGEGIRALTRTAVSGGELDRAGAAAVVRHPADFFIPQLVGAEHLRLQTSLGLPWLNRALTLRPRSPEAHYFVGLALQRAGKHRQALSEYVAAARSNRRLVRMVGDAVLRNLPLRRAALSDPTWATQDDEPLLEYVASGVAGSGSSDELFRLDERRIQIARSAADALAAITRQKARAMDDRALLMQLNAAIAVSERETSEPYLTMVAEIRARAGMTADAIKLLERAALSSPPPPGGVRGPRAATELVRLLLAGGRAREALQRVDDLQHRERLSNGDAEFLRGMIQEHQGDHQGAFYSYMRAAQYHPDDVEALVATALAAQRASRSDMARQYARRALEAGRQSAEVYERLAPIVGP